MYHVVPSYERPMDVGVWEIPGRCIVTSHNCSGNKRDLFSDPDEFELRQKRIRMILGTDPEDA